MNLPDFSIYAPLVRLKQAMGADEATWVAPKWHEIDSDDVVRQLRTTDGEIETATD